MKKAEQVAGGRLTLSSRRLHFRPPTTSLRHPSTVSPAMPPLPRSWFQIRRSESDKEPRPPRHRSPLLFRQSTETQAVPLSRRPISSAKSQTSSDCPFPSGWTVTVEAAKAATNGWKMVTSHKGRGAQPHDPQVVKDCDLHRKFSEAATSHRKPPQVTTNHKNPPSVSSMKFGPFVLWFGLELKWGLILYRG